MKYFEVTRTSTHFVLSHDARLIIFDAGLKLVVINSETGRGNEAQGKTTLHKPLLVSA